MRFAFTDQQLLFRDAVRDVLQKECGPEKVRQAWANESGRLPALWTALAELGITGLTAPESLGGLGMDERDLVLLLEEAGRAALPEPLLETTAVAVPLLLDAGDSPRAESLRERWLPAVVAGEATLAVGLESSPFVLGAGAADLLLLQRGNALYALPPDAVSLNPQASVDGARRLFTVEWAESDSHLVVQGDVAARALESAFDRGALGASAQLLGIAQHLIDVTVEYAKVREQFGKPIGSFQAVKHLLADALLKLEFARPLVYRAADSVARGLPERQTHVSMGKAYASDAALHVARVALQCHGAIAYTVEYDLHLWMKRAWALAAAWGDAAWHRARVGSVILAPGFTLNAQL